MVKTARDAHNKTEALKSKLIRSGVYNLDERVKQENLKPARKSMLKDLYPKTAEGYGHWSHFINKEYYEKYVPKPKTVFELCVVKEVKNEVQD